MNQITLTHPHPGVLRATLIVPDRLLTDETVDEVGERADLIEPNRIQSLRATQRLRGGVRLG
jgi:hypothetical protein